MIYGSDSNSATFPVDYTKNKVFYVGRIGFCNSANLTYFNSSLASKAISSGGWVDLYYFLTSLEYAVSSGAVPAGTYDHTTWGEQMAKLAIQEANSLWYKGYNIENGATIYADVEDTSSGTYWGAGIHNNNYTTLSAFLNYIFNNSHYTHGIYSGPSAWNQVMGNNSGAALTGNAWTNEKSYYCPTTPPTDTTNMQTFSDFTVARTILWQYQVSGGPNTCPDGNNNDFNVAIYG